MPSRNCADGAKRALCGGAESAANRALPYEIRAVLSFRFGEEYSLRSSRRDTFEQPRHTSCEIAHCLHTLLVLHDFLRRFAVYHIPVGGRNDRHAADAEILVDDVERRRRPSPARGHDRGTRLALEGAAARIERAVEHGQQLPGRMGVVDRRAEHEPVALFRFFRERIRGIVVENAFAAIGITSKFMSPLTVKNAGTGEEEVLADGEYLYFKDGAFYRENRRKNHE